MTNETYLEPWEKMLTQKSKEEVLTDKHLNIMNFNIFFGQALKVQDKPSFEKELDNLEILGKTLIEYIVDKSVDVIT